MSVLLPWQEYRSFCRRSNCNAVTGTTPPVQPGRKFHRFEADTTCGVLRNFLWPVLRNLRSPSTPEPRVGKRQDVYASSGYANIFAVHNILTADECAALVAAGEKFGFEHLEGEYPSDYRNNDRVLLHDPTLANGLWHRLRPHFRQGDIVGIQPTGFGNDGVWLPTGLNECIKMVRYRAGGKFRPHFDGPYVPEEDWASVYTVVIYLNDDFEGGQTVFMAEQADAFRIDLAPSSMLDKRVRARMQPRTGSVLLFNHDVLHEGTPVAEGGTKYMLRAEVMFSRVDLLSGRHQRDAHECSVNYHKCQRLYKEVAMHERKGNVTQFCSTYLRALKLQFEASRSIAAQFHKNCHVRTLLSPYGHGVLYWPSLSTLTNMMTFLPPSSLCAVMATGQTGCAAARLREVWFGLVVRSAPFGARELRVLCDARLTHDWMGFFKVVHLACRMKATSNKIAGLPSKQLNLLHQEAMEFTHPNREDQWMKVSLMPHASLW